jgi:hypothetical protein
MCLLDGHGRSTGAREVWPSARSSGRSGFLLERPEIATCRVRRNMTVGRAKARRGHRPTSWRKHWFRPVGRVTFSSRGKSNQKRLPLHSALRFAPGSFASSSLQGHAAKGHPWPIAALAASMPLNPFHDDSVHPPERGGWCRLPIRAEETNEPKIIRRRGLRSPSGGRVEGLRSGMSRMDAARGLKGHGWPL